MALFSLRSRRTARRTRSNAGLVFSVALTVFAASCARTSHQAAKSTGVAAKSAASTPPPSSAARTIAPTPASAEIRLGVIKVIGSQGSFVLIETPSAAVTAAIPAGHLLHCRTPGAMSSASTADLRVSPERRQPFLIADVVSGQPTVGDIAYLAADAPQAPSPPRPALPFALPIPASEPTPSPAAQ